MNYCDPDWHNGSKVEADYKVRGLIPKSEGGSAVTNYQPDHLGDGGTYVCCRQHLETTVYIMTGRYDRVMVQREERMK